MLDIGALLDHLQALIVPLLGYLSYSINTLHRDVAVLASKVSDLRETEDRRTRERRDIHAELDLVKNRVTILESTKG